MPSIDSVGCWAVPRSSARMLTVDSLITMKLDGRALRAARGTTRRAQRACGCGLLLHQLGLHCSRQLRGEVDVTRQVGLALHRMGLTGDRVLEDERREGRRRRLLAAGCEGHGPVDREPCVVVLGRPGVELE